MVLAGLQFSPFCGFGQVLNLIPGTGFPLHGFFLAMFLPGYFGPGYKKFVCKVLTGGKLGISKRRVFQHDAVNGMIT